MSFAWLDYLVLAEALLQARTTFAAGGGLLSGGDQSRLLCGVWRGPHACP